MKHKKIMLANNQKDLAIFRSIFKTRGLNPDDLIIIPHTFRIDELINKETDLMSAYSTNELPLLKEKGYKVKIFYPKDYGFDYYDDIIFTSKEFMSNNPKLVKDFYDASLKGWEYTFNNIEEVAKLFYEKYNTQNKSLINLISEVNEMKKLAYDKDGKFGTITKEKINSIINSYKVMGVIKDTQNIDDLIYTNFYNNVFLLDKKEEEYLKNKKELTICIDPDWMPFEKIKNGKHIGISADYIKLIQEKINISINLIQTKDWSETINFAKNRVCDIVPLLVETKEREKYLNFTSPYIKLPLVIAGAMDASFIDDVSQIKSKKIGIPKDYAFTEILEKKYSNLDFVFVKNMEDGFKQIQKGEIDGLLGNLTTLGYTIQKDYIGQIKIIAKLDEVLHEAIASRNDEPLLNNILEKALHTIKEQQREDIFNKWVSVNYQKEIDYAFFYEIFAGTLILISILILAYR